ncbi:TetR family transcriptional regulator [Natranaerovirga hydrolytica]|uniref:TetR family transcriptional regulator n=1 Tax=Natranaerovirga hydrolytica TaxID=680378 RepID=A0A4R1MGW0_9FIRM|nr:TetR/AcrR family transcriptional regulator [Natranaerovirga hydrolytica]TCK89143.1 TetR family transcriptional regulator [Natranaerovirga hydrolytica]
MNSLFLKIDIEKQVRIINAGLDVFSKYPFKHALTEDIASQAGIAKGSLFQYFKNKRTFYIYLYDYALQKLGEKVNTRFDFTETDIFEIVQKGMLLKLRLLEDYPYLYNFILQANQEKDEILAKAIQEINTLSEIDMMERLFKNVDRSKFKKGINVKDLLKRINWCSEGLRQEGIMQGKTYQDMKEEAMDLIEFFKRSVYLEEFFKRGGKL